MKKKSGRWVLLGSTALLLYLLVFPVSLERELLIRPVWCANVDTDPVQEVNGTRFGFRLGDTLGFFSPDGRIALREPVLFTAVIADGMFVNFLPEPDRIYLKDAWGRIVLTIPESGYPLIENGRIFVIAPDRSGISEWSTEGLLLWRKDFVSLITDLSVSESFVLFGLLEGDVFLVDRNGRETARLRPEVSRLPVVYGVAISDDENLLAVISGIDPKRLVLYRRKNDVYKPVHQRELEGDFRRRMVLGFSSTADILQYEEREGLAVEDVRTKRQYYMKTAGRVLEIADGTGDLMSMLTEAPPRGESSMMSLVAFLAPERRFIDVSFPGNEGFLRLVGTSLFLGAGDTLLRVDLVEG